MADTPDPSGGQLRERLDEARRETRELADELNGFRSRNLLQDAGWDPDSPEGRALAKTYDGEPDPTKVREFAQSRYGWQAPTEEAANAAAADRAVADAWDAFNQTATTVTPPVPDVRSTMSNAEAAGDWPTWDRMAAEQLEDLRETRAEYRQSPPSTPTD